jgi:hypothetical protein
VWESAFAGMLGGRGGGGLKQCVLQEGITELHVQKKNAGNILVQKSLIFRVLSTNTNNGKIKKLL